MNSQIATVIACFVILALFALGRDRSAQTSKVLWIPAVWLLLGASRNVSEWFHLGAPVASSDRYVEGSPVDQLILAGLFLIALIALIRRRQLGAIIRSNPVILVYFAYCGVSILWSDYPGVSARRWIKSLGDVTMALIVLTDPEPLAALRRLFARVGFILVPMSILFIRYFPNLGRTYSRAGATSWTGVGTDKNALGMVCLIFGLASVWYFFDRHAKAMATRKHGPVVAHGAFLAMVVWLLVKANSATSFVCFFVAAGVISLTSRPSIARRPAIVHLLVAGVLAVSVITLFTQSTDLVGFVGRDSTLTGRTDIWDLALGMNTNRLVGTGYESFWVGERLETIHREWPQAPNQAHNGYIEILLNLGWVGVTLLVVVLLTGYWRLVAALGRQERTASLGLAYLVVSCIYNCTEAAFKMMHPSWIALLIAITAVPKAPVPKALPARKGGFAPLVPTVSALPGLRWERNSAHE